MALIFGLVAFPLLGLVGAAVDFGLASSAKAQLDTALDSAALLATTSASNAIAAGTATDVALAAAQSLATSRFTAQVAGLSAATITNVSATVTASSGTLSAVIKYTADYSTSIAEIFGIGTIPLFGQSATTLATSPYADIHMLVDTSTSMAIGATQADMDALGVLNDAYLANPPVPVSTLPTAVTSQLPTCALSCHWTNAYPDYYATAQSAGVTMRIDVVRNAVSNAVSQLTGLNAAGQFRLGLYTFSTAVNTIYPLSGSISGATSVMSKINLGLADMTGATPFADTDFPDAVATVTNIVGTAGDGSSQATPRKYLIIITDGVIDYYLGGGRVINATDSTSCNQAKANGVTVMILYTPYIPLVPPYVKQTNETYTAAVQPIQANIWPSIQACASQPSFAWQASDQLGITAALTQMLTVATKTPTHFTQ